MGDRLTCETTVLHRGRTAAVMESTVQRGSKLGAKAQGTYAIVARP